MLAVKLMGGLGNQLFQYAFGQRLAAETGQKVAYETSFFDHNPHRPLDLRHLVPDLPLAPPHRVPRKARRYAYDTRLLDWLFPRLPERYERKRTFDEAMLRADGPAYFEGFWQSLRYFEPLEARLRAQLHPDETTLLSAPARRVLERIRAGTAVGVHVRRGDYVANPAHRATYAECTPAYFQAGAGYLASRFEHLHFFIFSDDAAWTRTHVGLAPHRVSYVSDLTSLDDFLLLKACRHQLLPNSTFGWWAGWLNESPDKVVVMPRHWFRRPAEQAAVSELHYERAVLR
jgi:hypothetical protein